MATQPQTILGRFCHWCGEPAVGKVTLEPGHAFKGKRGGESVEMWRQPREADVCVDHLGVCDRQGGAPMPDPRRRAAGGVVQLDIFGNEIVDGRPRKPGNAIKGTS
jgi:hypothetical protein